MAAPIAQSRPQQAPQRAAWLVASGVALGFCWWWLWAQRTYWNPLFFTGLWTAATVFVRALSGQQPLPLRRHLVLMAISAPLWWWFEFVNEFVRNWQYHGTERYSPLEYQVFATLAFSTVVPALHAAWNAAGRWAGALPLPPQREPARLTRASAWWVVAAGAVMQASVFLWPTLTFPLVWVAPFLVSDGLVSLRGGDSLLALMRAGRWRLPLAIAAGGLACGLGWELWNYYALPKWTYDIGALNFWHLFEMPVLGYSGYVPFAWNVYQVVALVEGWRQPPGR